MALITWNDALSVGVPEIDRQHKKLIDMINELDDATRAGHGKDIVSGILDGLIIYTATHFRTEEKYFDQLGYQDAEVHKQEHAVFIENVGKFASELNRALDGGSMTLATELMSFLGIWWKYHILETDMKYAKLFHEKGIEVKAQD
jgi:hemerythrin